MTQPRALKLISVDYDQRCHDMKQLRQHMGCDGSDLEQLRAAWDAKCQDIKRLQAIVDKLPKTADGVPVVPDDLVYYLNANNTITECNVQWRSEDGRYWACRGIQGPPFRVEKCYSTRKAAEAGGDSE